MEFSTQLNSPVVANIYSDLSNLHQISSMSQCCWWKHILGLFLIPDVEFISSFKYRQNKCIEMLCRHWNLPANMRNWNCMRCLMLVHHLRSWPSSRTIKVKNVSCFLVHVVSSTLFYGLSKWNEWDFRPPLCTGRLNLARRTSWG